jgi:hypothetical protein
MFAGRNRRHRPIMTAKDRAKLRNIADRLQVILDELRAFEKTTDDSRVKQAALSAALALAWLDLVGSLTERTRANVDEHQ